MLNDFLINVPKFILNHFLLIKFIFENYFDPIFQLGLEMLQFHVKLVHVGTFQKMDLISTIG